MRAQSAGLTLRTLLSWWWWDLQVWWQTRRDAWAQVVGRRPLIRPVPRGLSGRLVTFQPRGTNLGKTTFSIVAVRGRFSIGRIEWRNQWNTYAVYLDGETPVNAEILAEIYAMLRELK